MPLDPEDWLRLKEVFEGGRALPADQRPAYLDGACHDIKNHLLTLLDLAVT
jgi:hypothetical protein